jgi:putative endonuclease
LDRRRVLGADGEAAVAAWYEAQGYEVLDRNWRCRDGELDLVVAREGVLVFCEVKTRRSTTFGAPVEAVTTTKQRRLRGLALRWLADHPERRSGDLRFDVGSVLVARGAPATIEVVEGAF